MGEQESREKGKRVGKQSEERAEDREGAEIMEGGQRRGRGAEKREESRE